MKKTSDKALLEALPLESTPDDLAGLDHWSAHAGAGPVVGLLTAMSAGGEPFVDFPGNEAGKPIRARTTVALAAGDVGREVILLLQRADPRRPIIIGCILGPAARGKAVDAKLDGDQLVLTADKEIVLRCGKASITLTRAGKVIIRGAYVLSRSSGVNRIKGGSVQIN